MTFEAEAKKVKKRPSAEGERKQPDGIYFNKSGLNFLVRSMDCWN